MFGLRIFRLLFTIVLYFRLIAASAQHSGAEYYFVKHDFDTVFCKSLSYGTGTWGVLNRLEYTTPEGISYELRGKNNIPKIITFYLNGKTFDRIPYNLGGSKKLYVYSERITGDKLKVYLDPMVQDESVIYRFYVRIEDGNFYKVDKRSDFENVIVPFMMKCEKFRNALDFPLTKDEKTFIKAAKLFNSLCEY